MTEMHEAPVVTAVPIEMLQAASAAFAGWEAIPDREAQEVILNRGIVEEAPECVAEMERGDIGELTKELGDMQWYISERARMAGLTMAEICGPEVDTLEDFQQQAVDDPAITPIWVSADRALDLSAEPAVALSVLAYRIADVETITEERLWRGHDNGIPLQQLLRDLYIHVAVIANDYGISLADMLDRNIEKLMDRNRNAHVLEDAKATAVSAEVEEPEVVARREREAYAVKVTRQRAALGVAVQHLFSIDDGLLEQELGLRELPNYAVDFLESGLPSADLEDAVL